MTCLTEPREGENICCDSIEETDGHVGSHVTSNGGRRHDESLFHRRQTLRNVEEDGEARMGCWLDTAQVFSSQLLFARVSEISMCCKRKGWSGHSRERVVTVNILHPLS